MKLELNQKKVTITASIISVAFIVALLNQQILRSQNETGRAIASVGEPSLKWQYDLAKKLSKDTRRDLASLGSRPNEMDLLRFGLLEGKYSLRFNNGILSEVEFAQSNTNERPKYIPDKIAFLTKYKQVFNIGFTDIKEKVNEDSTNGPQTQQSYELVGAQNKVLANATFQQDTEGRLISLKVTPIPSE